MKLIWPNCLVNALKLALLLSMSFAVWPSVACGEDNDVEQQTRRIRQIVLSRGENPMALANLVQLSKELDAEAAALLYRQLADDYLQAGLYNQAGNVLKQLVLQYPEQPVAAEGLLAAIRLYASSEVTHTQMKSSDKDNRKSSAAYALFLLEQALAKHGEWGDDPALCFQCSVAARMKGNARSGLRWLTPLKHNTHSEPWNHRAQTESWLFENRKETSPKQTLACLMTNNRPHLDGLLDEAFWQTAGIAVIVPAEKSLAGDGSAQIRLARDEEFLYLAIRCAKPPGVSYVNDNLPRAHDAKLSDHDHIRIQLDADRDYVTAFSLSVDHRGQTADACWLDTGWNPQWYVASQQDDSHWTIEAAIAWEELTPHPPTEGEAWALSIERVLPGEVPQSWATGLDSVEDGFGLVVFE